MTKELLSLKSFPFDIKTKTNLNSIFFFYLLQEIKTQKKLTSALKIEKFNLEIYHFK